MTDESPKLWHRARFHPKLIWQYRVWHTGHAKALKASANPSANNTRDDETHLRAAIDWLCRAQDVTGDGGVAGRYRMDQGWTSSYPETTGYIIPTFIALAADRDPQFFDRAARCVDFLLGTQIASGAFPAGEIANNSSRPSPFNTAQIIHGLVAWHAETGAQTALDAAIKAGDWLVSEQDDDGAWRRWFYHDTPATYSAFLSCWLAELGAYVENNAFLNAAHRHIDWVLAQQTEKNGWLDQCGFTNEEQTLRIADLHTIAYTLGGLIRSADLLKREEALEAVRNAASHVANTLREQQWIPGMLDHQWRARADSACLTGNVQMALIWMRLYQIDEDPQWLKAATDAIELVKQTQCLESPNDGLRGGIAGPSPLWGWYNDGAFVNWAAKFFIDALLMKAKVNTLNSHVDP